MKRERPYRISEGLIKKIAARPGALLSICPRTPSPLETTDYVRLKVEGPYFDEQRRMKKILLSTFKNCGMPAPKKNVYDHYAQVLFRAAPQEIIHPTIAAQILREHHGDPELIAMLEADRMDLLYLDPEAPNDGKTDANGNVYERHYVYCTSINDFCRAGKISPQAKSGHCTLPLKQLPDESPYGVGRLWQDGETTHLLSWRHPSATYGLNRPPLQDESHWSHPGLSAFGRDGRGLIILFDIELFNLIYYRYLQACAYLMPVHAAICSNT